MWMLWYWNMWNVGKEKRFVCCCKFLGLKFLFMRRFSKINSMQKDVKLKSCIGHFLYCWQLFKDIHTLVGGSQLFKKHWCGYIVNVLFALTLLFIFGFCLICIHIFYILLIGCNSSMIEGWIHAWIDEWRPNESMSFIHSWITFVYTIHLYCNKYCV